MKNQNQIYFIEWYGMQIGIASSDYREVYQEAHKLRKILIAKEVKIKKLNYCGPDVTGVKELDEANVRVQKDYLI